MQDKIQEIMGLVLNVACAGIDYGRATQNADGGALKRLQDSEKEVESKLRELVRVPLEDCDMWAVVCQNIDANEFSLYELNAMFEIGRNVERAHNITNASGVA